MLREVLMLVCIWNLTQGTPTCTPTAYPVSVGINTTENTVLTTLLCTSGGTIVYTIDPSSDGYSYFEITGNDVILANRIDVEYGQISWTVNIDADDGTLPSVTLTLTATTFRSTTTTTSTQPPPGYDWFDQTNNRYLFWSVMAFITLMTGSCILLCIRFHRFGRCLPDYCPEYSKMIESFNRQFTCCPVPCNYYEEKKDEEEEEEEKEWVDDTPWGLPPRKPPTPITWQNAPKKDSEKKAKKPKKKATKPKQTESQMNEKPENTENESERPAVVSPLIIGNVNLDDVGFDGMRSPGFNAPMFTTYGGKKDKTTRSHHRRY
ncbi:hypothetical protein ACF0H5_023073 [Mactra antiquata]